MNYKCKEISMPDNVIAPKGYIISAKEAHKLSTDKLDYMNYEQMQEIMNGIKNIANKGEYKIVWGGILDESVKEYLIKLGYSVSTRYTYSCVDYCKPYYEISWY